MVINWNTDERAMKKLDPQGYKIWRVVQQLNYGLDGQKFNKQKLKRLWPQIRDRLDLDVKKTLEYFLWGKKWRGEPGLRPDRSNFWPWFLKTKLSALNSTLQAERHLPVTTSTTASPST